MIKVSHFGHTSKGSKSSFPAYCIYCVTQIAADQIGAGWRIFSWGGLAHVRPNPKVTQCVVQVSNEV